MHMVPISSQVYSQLVSFNSRTPNLRLLTTEAQGALHLPSSPGPGSLLLQ